VGDRANYSKEVYFLPFLPFRRNRTNTLAAELSSRQLGPHSTHTWASGTKRHSIRYHHSVAALKLGTSHTTSNVFTPHRQRHVGWHTKGASKTDHFRCSRGRFFFENQMFSYGTER